MCLLLRDRLTRVSRYQCHVFTDLVGIEWAIYLSLGEITFNDSVIASSLCYLLATSRTGFSRQVAVSLIQIQHPLTQVLSTDSLLTKLMAYIINTGLLTRYFSFEPNHT